MSIAITDLILKKKRNVNKQYQTKQNEIHITNNISMQSFEIESHLQLDEFRLEIQRRDQEILAMAAKMKTLEEQHQV